MDFVKAMLHLKLKAPRCFLLSVHWHRGQETEHHRPQNPSTTLLQQDCINDHLLHIASVSIYSLPSFLEDSVNNGSMPMRKGFRSRKPGES